MVAGFSQIGASPVDPTAFILVVAIPMFVGLALMSAALRLRIRSRSASSVRLAAGRTRGAPALSVPFQLPLVIALWLAMVGALPLLLLVAALSALVAFDTSPPHFGPLAVGAVMILLACPTVLLIVDGLRGNAPRGALLLSPDGVLYRTLGYDAWMSWDSIESVSVASGDGQQIVITGYTNTPPRLVKHSWLLRPSKKIRAQADASLLVVRGLALSIDPVLALYTLRFYHANPAVRAELGTGTAVERVRGGGVVPV